MFLKIKAKNFICFDCGVFSKDDLEQVNDEFLINLSLICHIKISNCSININQNSKIINFKYKIEFDRFADEGVLNYFNLYFKSKNDKEFKRIVKRLNIRSK